MLVKPHQGLAHGPDPLELVEYQPDGFLNSPIGILLQPMLFGLTEPDRRGDDQLATLGHRAAGLQGTRP